MVCCLHVVTVSAGPQFPVILSEDLPKEHFFSWLWNQISTPPLSSHFLPPPRPNPSSIHTFALFTPPFYCCSLLCLCCHHHLPLHCSLKPSDPNSPFASVPLTLFHLQLLGERLSRRRMKGGPIAWDLLSPHWEAVSKWQQQWQAERWDCPLSVPWALQ